MADSNVTVLMETESTDYSSEQYKYLLLRRLQRHFSLTDLNERIYTQTFFGKLFDGVTVTKENYNNFIQIMDDELDYCAENNIRQAIDIDEDIIKANKMPLINAFAEIGISLEITIVDYGGDATFTKPDGSVMVYKVRSGSNDFYINAVAGQEYNYAQLAAPYYQMKYSDVVGLDEIDFQRAGPSCFWSYNADTTTMTITGDGTYYGVSKEEQIGSGAYTTLIIGPNIETLNSPEARKTESLTTIVLLHASDFPLVISEFAYGSQSSYLQKARTWDVYTDNEVFKGTTFPEKITINWHSLDEWDG